MASELTETLAAPILRRGHDQALPLRAFNGLMRFAARKPLGAFSGLIVAIMIVAAALTYAGLADDITGYRYDRQSFKETFQSPSAHHVFGTDQIGRDIFSRVFYGSRVSITIGFAAVAISQGVGALIGIVSGYYGGKLDFLFQRVVDIGQAMPGLIALIFLVSVLGPRQWVIIGTIGVLGSWGQSRVIRGAVLSLRNNQYVEAAKALGASDRRILIRHILPNVVHLIIIGASIGIGSAILIESALAFLGLGLPPPFPTWGRMINEARPLAVSHPFIALWPGLALTLTVFSFNILGDALRDVWDPRLRGSR